MCLIQSTLFSDATATIVKDEFAILPLLSFLCLLMGVEHSILLLLLDDDRLLIGGRMLILMLIIGSIDIVAVVVAVAGSTIRVW